MEFSTQSIVVALIAFVLVALVPIKLVASFFGGKRVSFGATFVALVLCGPAAYLGWEFSGIGVLGAYLAIAVVTWLVLQPPFGAALVIPAVAVLIMVGVVQMLSHLRLLGFST